MIRFLEIFLGFKLKNTKPYEPKLLERAEAVVSWMYKYSGKKFSQIHLVDEFKIVFQNAYEHHLDEIFEREVKTFHKNEDRYRKAFVALYKRLA